MMNAETCPMVDFIFLNSLSHSLWLYLQIAPSFLLIVIKSIHSHSARNFSEYKTNKFHSNISKYDDDDDDRTQNGGCCVQKQHELKHARDAQVLLNWNEIDIVRFIVIDLLYVRRHQRFKHGLQPCRQKSLHYVVRWTVIFLLEFLIMKKPAVLFRTNCSAHDCYSLQ